MTVPGRMALFIAGVLALLMLGAVAYPVFIGIVLAGDVLLLVACLVQRHLLAPARVTVEPDGWSRLEIGAKTDLRYRIENLSTRPLTVTIRQPWPAAIKAQSSTLEVWIDAGEAVWAAITVTALKRGRVRVPPMQIDIRLATNLVQRRWSQNDHLTVTVYPNLRAIAEYDMLRRHHALSQFGIHRTRMIGSGREFDQLREYLPDDNYGDINWKATARRRQLVTNVYQAERSQDIMLCLDCGRMMGNPIGTGTMLDRAIDASTMLTHVCTRWGDRVGLALFRDTVTQYIKPAGGGRSTHRIIEELVNATPEGVFPSYTDLIAALRSYQKRRGMVFLFTDLNDPQLASNLTEVLPLASRRHVVVVISLRDPLFEQIASGPATDPLGACQVLAARHLADERSARVRELFKAGVQVLEVDADSITLDAINAYLMIKMRQLV